jgi:hypothetical protein
VKSEYKQLRIRLADVLYFEGLKDYIKIWLKDNPKASAHAHEFKVIRRGIARSKIYAGTPLFHCVFRRTLK